MEIENSQDFTSKAHEIESALRKAMSGKQNKVAEALGWSESRMTRFKAGSKDEPISFTEIATMLAVLGLGVAPNGVVLAPDDYSILRKMANLGMQTFLSNLPDLH